MQVALHPCQLQPHTRQPQLARPPAESLLHNPKPTLSLTPVVLLDVILGLLVNYLTAFKPWPWLHGKPTSAAAKSESWLSAADWETTRLTALRLPGNVLPICSELKRASPAGAAGCPKGRSSLARLADITVWRPLMAAGALPTTMFCVCRRASV